MSNPATLFRQLLAKPALMVGVVSSTDGSVATVDLPGGGRIQARGETATGATVFVRDGAIEGDAPSLPIIEIEV